MTVPKKDTEDRRRLIVSPPSKEHPLGELFVFETYEKYAKKHKEIFGVEP